jgi:hypothetical protein
MNSILPLAALLTLAACSSAGAPDAASMGRLSTSRHVGLGTLQLRDRMVTMFATPDGLRVTLEDSAGKVLAEDISIDELRDRDLFAYQACRSGIAHGESYLDAALHLSSSAAAGER